MIDPSRVKAICFDVDGTLSDTDDEWVAQVERRLRALKIFLSIENLHLLARWLVMATETPMNILYRVLEVMSLDDHFAPLYENLIRRRKFSQTPFWLMNGAQATLTVLEKKFPLSIVSARDELTTQSFINQFSFESYFRVVVTSQTCEHTKPNPQPVLWAAEKMEVPPENCLMVGDTTVDILAGKAAGAQTVGLLCGFGTERELRWAGADLVLKELPELVHYLE